MNKKPSHKYLTKLNSALNKEIDEAYQHFLKEAKKQDEKNKEKQKNTEKDSDSVDSENSGIITGQSCEYLVISQKPDIIPQHSIGDNPTTVNTVEKDSDIAANAGDGGDADEIDNSSAGGEQNNPQQQDSEESDTTEDNYNENNDSEDNSEDESDEQEDSDNNSEEDQDNMAGITPDQMKVLLSEERKKKSCIEPVRFGGLASENAKAWLEQFNTYATLQGLSEADKISTFSLLLKGVAQLWYLNLKAEERDTWNKVKDAFQGKFITTNWVNLQKLETTKMKDFSNCEEYVNHILQMGNAAGLTAENMIPHLTRGLPETMRAQVIAHNPKTLDECLTRIYLTETLNKMSAPKPEVKAVDTGVDQKLSTLTEAVMQISERVERARPENRQQPYNQQRPYNQRQPYHQNRNDNSNNIGGIQCYLCGRFGHMRKDCWQNQSARRNFTRGRGQPYRGGSAPPLDRGRLPGLGPVGRKN